MKTKKRLVYLENLIDNNAVHDGEWLTKHDEQISRLQAGHKFLAGEIKDADKRIDKIDTNVAQLSDRVGRYRTDYINLERAVSANQDVLNFTTGWVLIWFLILTVALAGMIGWNTLLTSRLEEVNARTVAHQVLPK